MLLPQSFLLLLAVALPAARCEDQQPATKPEEANKEKLRGDFPQVLPGYAGLPVQLEPQLQYPQYPGFGYVQQKQYPRVQPQILIYGAAGQGQPILFGSGSPPGNFLIPQGSPQRPVFIAGYPKPAHIPPIEKDAEEVPTNPARIPPLASRSGPEKLETFNEGKNDKPYRESDQRPISGTDTLRPGQRFFILNGEPLFQNYQFLEELPRYQQDQQPQPLDQSQQNRDFLFQNQAGQDRQEAEPRYRPELRSAAPLGFELNEDLGPLFGQFRFQAPNDPYFPVGGDDVENDSIVVEADDKGRRAEKPEGEDSKPSTPSGPGTAQASPGAVALAGPGGVAGAAPKATALVGKGGLAVSSPQATAVAGPRREKDENATSTREFVLKFRE